MKKNFAVYIIILVLVLSLLSGCDYSIGMVGNTSRGKMDYSYVAFNSEESHSERLKEGQTLTLGYSVTVKKGKLTIIVTDPDKNEVLKKEFTQSSKDKIDITAKEAGSYTIHVKGEETSGGCHIKLNIN